MPAAQRYVKSQIRAAKHKLNKDIQPAESLADRSSILDEIFELILPALDAQLKGKTYLACNRLTVADLHVYCCL